MGGVFIIKRFDAIDKVFLAAVTCMLMIMVLRCTGLRILLVCGSSMQPTLREDSFVIAVVVADKMALQRGDVVTFFPPLTDDVAYVKRIVAVSGDVVEACGDVLLVNGKESEFSFPGTGIWGPTIVGDGCVFVLGDNRPHSNDSRIFGSVPVDQIVARVVT